MSQEKVEATFQNWCEVSNFLADKNSVFRNNFMACGGDYEKMSEVETLDDEIIEENIKRVSNFLEIKPRHHPKIENWKVPQIQDILVEQWFSILELLEANNTHLLLFPKIFAILVNEEDVEKVKESKEYTKLAETVSFFLLNTKESLNSTQNFSVQDMKRLTSLIYKLVRKQISLKPSTHSPTGDPTFSTEFLHGK